MQGAVALDQVLDFKVTRCGPLWKCEADYCHRASAARVTATAPDGTSVTHRFCAEHTPDV